MRRRGRLTRISRWAFAISVALGLAATQVDEWATPFLEMGSGLVDQHRMEKQLRNALTVAALLAAGFAYLARRMRPIMGSFSQGMWNKKLEKLKLLDLNESNLSRLREFGAAVRVAQTGKDSFITQALLGDLFKLNKRCVMAWVGEQRGGAQMPDFVCFYVVAPLNMSGCRDLLAGKIKTNRDLEAKHLSKRPGLASGLYVIEVYGNDFIGRGAILHFIANRILAGLASYDSLKYIFARPVNAYGRKQMEKYGFENIGVAPFDMHVLRAKPAVDLDER